MAVEIERRFLVKNDAWRGQVEPKLLYQAYLSVEKERTMRVRVVGDEAWLTLKGYISDVSRHEFEYPIPLQDALSIIDNMCPFKMKKHRYCIDFGGHTFEVDEYFGDNAPLVVAEIELPSEDTEFERPEWLGEEITHDGRFTNAYLSQHPYSAW
ncbi:hypothetical protein ADP71_30550 [Vitreoscilla sp. C1]|uniref:CYTH domain-containing protein n=1 Tax=Vitreoscilla sp. (strain C1) TaxID=96942 RepID=UPI00148E9468|nr:CYTH domain-containing protein [Vitreoscilla sp. C1]AUZ06250.2 hypothetical protein ADP71_30550 [Vitreoscilla sp. C1]